MATTTDDPPTPRRASWEGFRPELLVDDVRRDVDALFAAIRLYRVRRFMHQRFWEEETKAAQYAGQIEQHPRLESVAEHSWLVADTVLLLSSHFPFVDAANALRLAVLHDKMEMYIGDRSPIGRDGTGASTHAFNADRRWDKDREEELAITRYLQTLRPSARATQGRALHEVLHGRTPDARFVKAIDKLTALAFVVTKKRGIMTDKHLLFTLRYSEKAVSYFPPLDAHYRDMRQRLLKSFARRREWQISSVEDMIAQTEAQLALF